MYIFLDRDGVINERTAGRYVSKPEEFKLLPGVREAVAQLRVHAQRMFVVTNQAGIQKGLLTHADLSAVHTHMRELLPYFDGVYYCPHRPEQNCNCRKPQSGMAWLAMFAYAEVKMSESWMVGDSASDIVFGNRLGMKTVKVGNKPEDAHLFTGEATPHYTFNDLPGFAAWVAQHDSLATSR